MGYDLTNRSELEDACDDLGGEVVEVPAQGGGEEAMCKFETIAGGGYSDTPIETATYMLYEFDRIPMVEHIPGGYTGNHPIESEGHTSVALGDMGDEVKINRYNEHQVGIVGDSEYMEGGHMTVSLNSQEHREWLED